MKKKYNLAIALSLFVGLSNIHGQNNLLVAPPKIDSLQQLIKTHTNADKEKVRLLNEYARLCFYNQEYKDGFMAARDARELSKKLEYDDGLAIYYMTISVFSRALPINIVSNYYQRAAVMYSANVVDKAIFDNPIMPNGYPHPITEETLKKLQPALEYFTTENDKEILTAILFFKGVYYVSNRQSDKGNQLMDQILSLNQELESIDDFIGGYSIKIRVALIEDHRAIADSIYQELIYHLSQVKTENFKGRTLYDLSNIHFQMQQYVEAIENSKRSADYFGAAENTDGQVMAYQQMMQMCLILEMYSYQIIIFESFLPIIKESDLQTKIYFYNRAGWAYYNTRNYDRARNCLNYLMDSIPLTEFESRFSKLQKTQLEGQILMDEGKFTDALPLLLEAHNSYDSIQFRSQWYAVAAHIANCYYQMKEYQTALKYSRLSFNAVLLEDLRYRLKINLQLADIYDGLRKKDSVYKYLKNYRQIMAESNVRQSTNQILGLQINSIIEEKNEQVAGLEQARLLQEQKNKTQQVWIFSITGALLSTILILYILYRNNKNKQKANAVLERTLSNLKSAQSQLIQSEKMASLGELTAGIAHEIQNPLNFVNNFSEVSFELLEEMKSAMKSNNPEEASTIANSVIQNLEKILHHGKRADGIVKGMLLHSRGSSGAKEPTDINILADEYLRLAYHGLRAKDNFFDAKIETDFDQSLTKIEVVPQDIGRVILNLITNAFHAVTERKRNEEGFQPLVLVRTKAMDGAIEISVRDNGNGIPTYVLDKIFQPFFTTKPTGQGTGLGLSLSYDIVMAHGGDLKVETKTREGSVFTIELPAA